MMKRKELILMFLLLLTFSQKVSAQAIHITGTVSKLMKEMKGTESGKMPLSVPVYVFDNHNHALAFRYREFFKNTLSKGTLLLHLDQHSDMKSNPFIIQQENWESICSFTQNCCNVGNFILPALNSGLI